MSNARARSNQSGFYSRDTDLHKPASRLVELLIITFLALTCIGMANLYSASNANHFFYSQLNHSIIGIIVFVAIGWLLPIKNLNYYCYWIFGITIVALVAVLVLGHVSGGSQRWLTIGPIRGQPSEFAKLTVAIIVAHFFHHNPTHTDYRLRDLWPVGLMVLAVFILIFRQPDLGTAGICVFIAIAQIAMVPIRRKSIMIAGTSAFLMIGIAWFGLLHDYQKTRVMTLFNPELDPHGKGYNSLQSLIAVGSGKLFGKGFMEGTQTQLQFLPARHTDFVFSVFAEEHGFWAGMVVFALFGMLTYVALEISRQSKDTFSTLLAVGIAAYIFLQFTINVAMVLGMFPVVGMPLPFFSHGGSSILTLCTGLGLLVAIHRSINPRRKARRTVGAQL